MLMGVASHVGYESGESKMELRCVHDIRSVTPPLSNLDDELLNLFVSLVLPIIILVR